MWHAECKSVSFQVKCFIRRTRTENQRTKLAIVIFDGNNTNKAIKIETHSPKRK